ncbi:MAG: hypothetical protein GXO32_08280 [Crenarchaeota archaeon]|nr:hypothetical protein [Thermoproteota archaeon]
MKRVKQVDTSCPHGIYVYDREADEWVLVATEGEPFKPTRDGIYAIYFDNTKCPACRRYDPIWFNYVKKYSQKNPQMNFVIVLCEWFARNCKSEAASKTFKEFDVHASPTTVFLYVKGGKAVYKEKYEGVLYEFELSMITDGFADRAERSLRGEKVQPPIKATASSALQQLISELLKMIIEKEMKQGAKSEETKESPESGT